MSPFTELWVMSDTVYVRGTGIKGVTQIPTRKAITVHMPIGSVVMIEGRINVGYTFDKYVKDYDGYVDVTLK